MLLFSTYVPCILLFLTLFGYARSEDLEPPLSPFAQKVKDHLPQSAFDKLFDVDTPKDIHNIEVATDDEMTGIAESIANIPTEDSRKGITLKDIDISPESRFAILTNLMAQLFTKSGILTDKNINKLAKQYSVLLMTAADSLPRKAFVQKQLAVHNSTSFYYKSDGRTDKDIHQREETWNRYRFKRQANNPCNKRVRQAMDNLLYTFMVDH